MGEGGGGAHEEEAGEPISEAAHAPAPSTRQGFCVYWRDLQGETAPSDTCTSNLPTLVAIASAIAAALEQRAGPFIGLAIPCPDRSANVPFSPDRAFDPWCAWLAASSLRLPIRSRVRCLRNEDRSRETELPPYAATTLLITLLRGTCAIWGSNPTAQAPAGAQINTIEYE